MKIQELYKNIELKGINKIETFSEDIDNFIDDKTDTRMGITLTIRPTQEIKDKIEYVENEIRKIEPSQYYYPQEDYHITLLDIITARQNFKYTEEQVENSMKATEEAIKNAKKFKIKFDGIICSGGAIMVKGFYDDELETIRQSLRKSIPNNSMKLDERYPTMSSHITIGRFRKQIENRQDFMNKLQEYNKFDFGELEVTEIELICHNWYDSKKEVLKKYQLQ